MGLMPPYTTAGGRGIQADPIGMISGHIKSGRETKVVVLMSVSQMNCAIISTEFKLKEGRGESDEVEGWQRRFMMVEVRSGRSHRHIFLV